MYRYYGRSRQRRDAAIAGGVLVVLLAGAHAGSAVASSHPAAPHRTSESRAARAAIAYAEHQIGCPYVWAGTGPCSAGFDCSGLVYRAYRLPWNLRTAADQWFGLRHVKDPVAGDLVFFAGADGTDTDPGHVAMVLNPARHTMIEAYATGFNIRISTYGLPSSAPGDGDPVGFAEVG
jgi:cell wall-associated NlpC family hydrolase